MLWGLAGDLGSPASEEARYADLSSADACLQRTENRPDIFDEEALNRSVARWIEVCREAARADEPMSG